VGGGALKKKSFIFGDRSKIKTLVFSKNSSFDLVRLVRGGGERNKDNQDTQCTQKVQGISLSLFVFI
jgi:hypothetical protein